jgi:curved DNA-binding protein CbpA
LHIASYITKILPRYLIDQGYMPEEPREGIDYIVDLYAVAHVEQDAAEADIRQALNERAMEYHPDRLEGLAPEFQEKGALMTILLNRARVILLDTEKRAEYDDILSSWEGHISRNGTPIITPQMELEDQVRGKTPEEIEAIFGEQVEQIRVLTGYDPTRLTFLESLIEAAGDNIPEALRAQYEDALLQKENTLAVEEAQRSQLLGLPDIQTDNYAATLSYGEDMTTRLRSAREAKVTQLRLQALGGVTTRLALLSGEVQPTAVLDQPSQTTLDLPAYFDDQSRKVQEIANERARIADERLSNFLPIYPEEELQSERRDDLIIGVDIGDAIRWCQAKIDVDEESVLFTEMDTEIRQLLDQGDYTAVIQQGYGLQLIKRMENIDRQDLLGVAVGKYIDKYGQGEKTPGNDS